MTFNYYIRAYDRRAGAYTNVKLQAPDEKTAKKLALKANDTLEIQSIKRLR